MKPRIVLAETTLPDGSPLELQEHDGRHSLVVRGQELAGPSTKAVEEECARLACAPFRPARQPKLWFAGLGLGQSLAAACEALPQKRGTFFVAEPSTELPEWQKRHFPQGSFASDSRVRLEKDPGPAGLAAHAGTLHAIVLHLDYSPAGQNGRPLIDDRRWLTAAYDALQPGGLLAIAGSRSLPGLARHLSRAGFTVAEHVVPSSPAAKRPRMLPVWLAHKPGRRDENS